MRCVMCIVATLHLDVAQTRIYIFPCFTFLLSILFSWETILDPNKGSVIETEAGESRSSIRNLLQQRHVAKVSE